MDSCRRTILLVALVLAFTFEAGAGGGALVLQPGIDLQLDPAGRVQVLDARAGRPFVQLDAGGCQLRCAESCRSSRVSVVLGEALITIIEAGEYHFDRRLDRIIVIRGKARIRTRKGCYELSAGEVIVLGEEIEIGTVGPRRMRF